jgi:phosphoglycerol transferase MdoB-like AlkP superfamily enzyme
VGYVDDASSFLLFFLILSLLRFLPQALARLTLVGTLVAMTAYVVSNDLYFQFYHGYLGPAALVHAGDANRAGFSSLLQMNGFAALLTLLLPLAAALLWWRAPHPPKAVLRLLSTVLLLGLILGQTAFALRFSPIYMHRKENAFMYLIRESYQSATQGLDHHRLLEEEQVALLEEIKAPAGYQRVDSHHPLFMKPVPTAIPGEAKTTARNVLLVVQESIRASESGAYGASPSVTPNFDKLANRGVFASSYYAAGNQTARGEFAMLCGMLDFLRAGTAVRMNPDFPVTCLPEIFRQRGYATHWFHGNTADFFRRRQFFHRHGFEQLHDGDLLAESHPEFPKVGWGVADLAMVDHVVDTLEAETKPFFAEFLTLSNHHPFTWDWGIKIPAPLKPASKETYDLYRHGSYYTDHAIGRLIERIDSGPLKNNTLVVVTGDHGLWLFPNNKPLSEAQKYETYFRLPFAMLGPGLEALRVDAPTSQLDVAPTILDALGWTVPNAFLGRSLLQPLPAKRSIYMHQEVSFNYRRDSLRCQVPMGECSNKLYLHCYQGEESQAAHVCFRNDADLLHKAPDHRAISEEDKATIRQALQVNSGIQKLLRLGRIQPAETVKLAP